MNEIKQLIFDFFEENPKGLVHLVYPPQLDNTGGIELTIDNIQNNSPENYALELIDGNTIKCTVDGNSVYYAIMEIDGGTMKVSYVDVYTEQEYFNR